MRVEYGARGVLVEIEVSRLSGFQSQSNAVPIPEAPPDEPAHLRFILDLVFGQTGEKSSNLGLPLLVERKGELRTTATALRYGAR